MQAQDLRTVRPQQQIALIGHASRVESESQPVTMREKVSTVIWENPVHYNPGQVAETLGGDASEFEQLEASIRTLCENNGSQLNTIKAWNPPQKYPAWERAMRDTDIAIECKALNYQHTRYQKQKPAVKVLNYLSLGLPVICDSLPAYRELGDDGEVLLFADSIDEWKEKLTLLIGDYGLRKRLASAGLHTARAYSIENICARYREFFQGIVETKR